MADFTSQTTSVTVDRNDLIGRTSLSFIRNNVVQVSATGLKPLTKFYPFFNGVDVSQWMTPIGGAQADPLMTDIAGKLYAIFNIPANTFNTGTHRFWLVDYPDFGTEKPPGATISSCSAIYTATGLKDTYRQTVETSSMVWNTTVNYIDLKQPPAIVLPPVIIPASQPVILVPWVPEPAPPPAPPPAPIPAATEDPLAQTFFTYEIDGGCYITKIDIYFQSKDTTLPVTLEVRNVVNGYPGANLVHRFATVTLDPVNVVVSNDSSVATSFTFRQPIYLKENMDYCFVLKANTQEYNVWTSEFGKNSIEFGLPIFQQPHNGSLFRSENNRTWTAYQNEDIKFTIWKAEFDTTMERDITFTSNTTRSLVYGRYMNVTSGSSLITVNTVTEHGNKSGDKIVFQAREYGPYRGIPHVNLASTGGFIITVVDSYTFTIDCGFAATSTGNLESSGILNAVDVDRGGSGYTVAPLVFSGGGGSGAAATAIMDAGVIVGVNVTSSGTGYTSAPTLTIVGGDGVGAVLTPISEVAFALNLNKPYSSVAAMVQLSMPPNTTVVNTLQTSSKEYVVGLHDYHELNKMLPVYKEAVLVSALSQENSFGSNNSTEMIMRFGTQNKNVSPMIDMSTRPHLRIENYIVNSAFDPILEEDRAVSETAAAHGSSLARYFSKSITLGEISTGARVYVDAISTETTSFDVFLRTGLSNDIVNIDDRPWELMDCAVERNLSTTPSKTREYEFSLDELSPFDVYAVKIVLYSDSKDVYPTIKSYSVIILST